MATMTKMLTILGLTLVLSACGGSGSDSGSGEAGHAPADQAAFNTLVVGNRVVAEDGGYADFFSGNRFVELDGDRGSYIYTSTGANTGTLVFDYGDGDECTSRLTFTSRTEGTSSFTCSDGDADSGNWRLVESSTTPPPVTPSGYAPANQAAFNTLAVGNRVVAEDGGYTDFFSGNRFVELDGDRGSYTYTNTGANTGTLVFDYGDGDECTIRITFTSRTEGTSSFTCREGDAGSGSWRLVQRP